MNTNFERKYLEENIYCIENLLSDEELNSIMSMKVNWQNDRTDVHSNIFIGLVPNENRDYFKDVVEDRIRLVVDNENQKFRATNMVTKYTPNKSNCIPNQCRCDGYDLTWHYENHPGCDYESKWITLGVVLYFNDNYEGGELVFKDKPIIVKPRRGSLMVFPATEEYTHAVKKVKENERMVFSGFVYAKTYYDILNRSGLINPTFVF